MKKRFMSLLPVAALLAVAAAGPARAEAGELRAKVPFSFQVRGKMLPAGTYTLSLSNGIVFVTGATESAIALTGAIESRASVQPSLVFHRYGDQYVLRQVWTGAGSGRTLPESRGERELAQAAGRTRTAGALGRVVVPIG